MMWELESQMNESYINLSASGKFSRMKIKYMGESCNTLKFYSNFILLTNRFCVCYDFFISIIILLLSKKRIMGII